MDWGSFLAGMIVSMMILALVQLHPALLFVLLVLTLIVAAIIGVGNFDSIGEAWARTEGEGDMDHVELGTIGDIDE